MRLNNVFIKQKHGNGVLEFFVNYYPDGKIRRTIDYNRENGSVIIDKTVKYLGDNTKVVRDNIDNDIVVFKNGLVIAEKNTNTGIKMIYHRDEHGMLKSISTSDGKEYLYDEDGHCIDIVKVTNYGYIRYMYIEPII